MSKIDKKKAKLKQQIEAAEADFKKLLQQKISGAPEINLPKHQVRMEKLYKELQSL